MNESNSQMREINIHGYHINYEDSEKEAIYFLERHLNPREFQTIFDHAKLHREAFFQDREAHHYEVRYDNGEFYLEKA
jgi:hypothetical protein